MSVDIDNATGSSPRMRGTHIRPPECVRTLGIIPAYAGNTWYGGAVKAFDRDHPRVCGEHFKYGVGFVNDLGSSPRMRGTPLASTDHSARLGIIPAYAGNTRHSQPWQSNSWDHPRVCGEHLAGTTGEGFGRGSSPRMRGTLRWSDRFSAPPGIIPAYAGNTRLRESNES